MQTSVLIQLDNERGPFDWTLTPSPLPAPLEAQPGHKPHPPVPHIIALLDLDKLRGWSPMHKQILFQVYQIIDGQRSIEDIKRMLPFPPYVVEEALHILGTQRVIALP